MSAKPESDARLLVGCDKQRAGTPYHPLGVPALPLVTPYKFTNCPAVALLQDYGSVSAVRGTSAIRCGAAA